MRHVWLKNSLTMFLQYKNISIVFKSIKSSRKGHLTCKINENHTIQQGSSIKQDPSRNFKAEDCIKSAHEYGFNNGFDYKFIKTLEVTNEDGKATEKKRIGVVQYAIHY